MIIAQPGKILAYLPLYMSCPGCTFMTFDGPLDCLDAVAKGQVDMAIGEPFLFDHIDFEKNSITTTSKKTKKSMGNRPVPESIMKMLKAYIQSLNSEQEKIFTKKFNPRQWRKICIAASLADLKFHDLRRTFASVLAQNGISTAVTQRLLEHSSPTLTNKIYTNVDPVLRQAVEKLPIGEWLQE